ncbi:MAG: sulfite exporter TauE/SafE family protein [Deltaproteobacteria bacterium]|nr:sulfite exporter TauE/SafE family protein [Deltaproteobacteria bacterium]MBW2422176.1 sulfite exporter TauE/SafE family protein [Deltaproteobacteria bacterium]
MNVEVTQTSAFLLGLFGAVHCIGMCGGIVGALTQTAPNRAITHSVLTPPQLVYPLGYSLGRIASYTIAGALAGALGFALAQGVGPAGSKAMRLLAGLFMIAGGSYVANWWLGMTRFEALGAHLWRHVSPLTRHFQPADQVWKVLVLGALWGWLPCGLVYAALAMAATTGTASGGALFMLSFGLGTLPALVATGALASTLSRFTRKSGARWVAGGLVVAFGVWTIMGVFLTPHTQHHGHAPQQQELQDEMPPGSSQPGSGAPLISGGPM